MSVDIQYRDNMYSVTKILESTYDSTDKFRNKTLKKWTGKDVVSWGRWVCKCEGIQELNIDFSLLDTMNGEMLIQASQRDFELIFGYNFGHIFYAHLTDLDCSHIEESQLPLTVEEFNQNNSDDNSNYEFYNLDNKYNLPKNCDENICKHSECEYDEDGCCNCADEGYIIYPNISDDSENASNNLCNYSELEGSVTRKHSEYQYQEKHNYSPDENYSIDDSSIFNANIPDLDILGAYSELKFSNNEKHSKSQHHENNNYCIDKNGTKGYMNIYDEHIPDLFILGTYCELESSISNKDHGKNIDSHEENTEHSILSQDLYKKIETKSRRKERYARNWEFLVRLLADPRTNPKIVSWVDCSKGTFRLVQPSVVVALWNAKSKKNPISYHSFARGLRYHYKTGALFNVGDRKLVYGCGPEALELLNKIKSVEVKRN